MLLRTGECSVPLFNRLSLFVLRCNVQGQEDRRVLGLELDKDHHALFVAFSSCVIRVPLSRCAQHGACKKYEISVMRVWFYFIGLDFSWPETASLIALTHPETLERRFGNMGNISVLETTETSPIS